MIQISIENSSSRKCLIRIGWVSVQCKCSAPYYSFTFVIYKSFRRIFLTIFCCLVRVTLLDTLKPMFCCLLTHIQFSQTLSGSSRHRTEIDVAHASQLKQKHDQWPSVNNRILEVKDNLHWKSQGSHDYLIHQRSSLFLGSAIRKLAALRKTTIALFDFCYWIRLLKQVSKNAVSSLYV